MIKRDLDKWAVRYGYGNVLSTLTVPLNPRMSTATFHLHARSNTRNNHARSNTRKKRSGERFEKEEKE